jgi:hypothetical protein
VLSAALGGLAAEVDAKVAARRIRAAVAAMRRGGAGAVAVARHLG